MRANLFVKVDGQSAAALYYENTVPIAAARGMNQALEDPEQKNRTQA